jgi:hypothetical protein
MHFIRASSAAVPLTSRATGTAIDSMIMIMHAYGQILFDLEFEVHERVIMIFIDCDQHAYAAHAASTRSLAELQLQSARALWGLRY